MGLFKSKFPRKKFLLFLKDYLKNNKEVEIQDFLYNSSNDHVMSAFSALVDSEGSVDHYGLKRAIRIRMYSPKYLKKWNKLLSKFSIESSHSTKKSGEAELLIYGLEDFSKLVNLGFNLHHSKKENKLAKILSSYERNQVSRNSALRFYKSKVNRIKTSKEISEETGKSQRVVMHYLKKLRESKLIGFEKKDRQYYYFPTQSTIT